MSFPGKRGLQRRNCYPRSGETWDQFYERLEAEKQRRVLAAHLKRPEPQ